MVSLLDVGGFLDSSLAADAKLFADAVVAKCLAKHERDAPQIYADKHKSENILRTQFF